jgi:hypothetical protein
MDPVMRAYGWLLRCYPATFRAEYEQEMRTLFGDQLREARASGRRSAVPFVFARGVLDVVVTAPPQHVRKEMLVSQPVDPHGSLTMVSPTSRRVLRALALSPFILWAVLVFVAPGFMDPVFMNPPGILGLPAGIVVAAGAMLLALVAAWVVWRTRSTFVALAAIVALTVPSMALILFEPAIILIVQNLAV